jgi:transcriptional regulator MraZ
VFFLGTFDYSMDERGRVPLPPRYREAFRAGIVLSQGSPDRCIRAFTPDEFRAHVEKITSASSTSSRGRDLRRGILSSVLDAQLDAQNRVLIPGWLRDYAGISTRVRLIGCGESLEIWAPELLETDLERIAAVLPSALESLDERRG